MRVRVGVGVRASVSHRRHAVGARLAPHGLGLRLRARDGIDNECRAV